MVQAGSTKTDGASIARVFICPSVLCRLPIPGPCRGPVLPLTVVRNEPEQSRDVSRDRVSVRSTEKSTCATCVCRKQETSLLFGATPVWISVSEWIKSQLPERFMPMLICSSGLIPHLLFLAVICRRQSKRMEAEAPLCTNHTDLVQWKNTACFRLIW